jgi:hypothetical protein
MSDRAGWGDALVNGRFHKFLSFAFLPQGTSAPILGEGDPKGTYISLTRTGVGTYQIVTKDPYVAFVGASLDFIQNAPAGNWNAIFGAPSQGATKVWTIPFTLFLVATATDIAANANNRCYVTLEFRDSNLLP